MSNFTASFRRSAPASDDVFDSVEESAAAAAWLAVVSESVKSMRYGVVQIVVHDSRVVQVERTERTRFDVAQAASRR